MKITLHDDHDIQTTYEGKTVQYFFKVDNCEPVTLSDNQLEVGLIQTRKGPKIVLKWSVGQCLI